ncbi:MAG TPA: Hsp20/alpha crystallin family protein [Desulfobulbaceae bacterium]|nr:Hsp20/alpha crystallin family protein [Desulfobulbaceae bacterium]
MMRNWQNVKTGQRQREGQPEFILPVDIIEGDHGFRMLCMLPGVESDQVSVEMDGNVLTVSGERRFPALEQGERLESVESQHGFFKRQFKIPERADSHAIAARYDDGILEISIPKRDSVPARSIPVNVAAD